MASDSPAERAHWRSVLKSYDGYMQYHLSANHARRMAFLSLQKGDREVYEQLGYRDKLDAVDEGIRRNAEFLDEMISDPVFAEMLQEPDAITGEQVDSSLGGSKKQETGGDDAGNNGAAGLLTSPDQAEPLAQSHSHSHSHPHNQASSSNSHSHSHSHTTSSPAPPTTPSDNAKPNRHEAQDKVRSTLRSFVRDWSAEGADERQACYDVCLNALEQHWEGVNYREKRKAKAEAKRAAAVQDVGNGGGEEGDVVAGGAHVRERSEFRVLVPGCGLGRLAMEVAALGFESQGNEFSTYMLLASNWVLNQSSEANSHTIHPFLHSFSNHLSTPNMLRPVSIPDICPRTVLEAKGGGPFSLIAGDFEEIYGVALDENNDGESSAGDEEMEQAKTKQRGQWGAVVTCFFIDCARNVLQFLRIIHALLEEGGAWINIGPLLWHFENSPTSGKNGEGSIELSLDEVRELAYIVGFDIQYGQGRQVKTTYTGIPGGMLRHEYNAAFWIATKRTL